MKLFRITTLLFLGVFSTPALSAENFSLTSPQITNNGKIAEDQVYKGFGCSGKNISPELHWQNAPAETKSFALTLYDPDAPTGSGWWHWIVYDIPAAEKGLPLAYHPPADKAFNPQKSIEYVTDFGSAGYGGPCPPQGDKAHRYIFTVYALKVDKLNVPAGASQATVRFMIEANTIAKAQLTGLYGR